MGGRGGKAAIGVVLWAVGVAGVGYGRGRGSWACIGALKHSSVSTGMGRRTRRGGLGGRGGGVWGAGGGVVGVVWVGAAGVSGES